MACVKQARASLERMVDDLETKKGESTSEILTTLIWRVSSGEGIIYVLHLSLEYLPLRPHPWGQSIGYARAACPSYRGRKDDPPPMMAGPLFDEQISTC